MPSMLSRLIVLAFAALSASHALAAVPLYGQCGGSGWGGETNCASGSTCTVVNQWYHQCIPGTNVPSTAAQATTTAANPLATNVPTGSLQEIKNFGTNPTGVRFFIYVPAGLAANPAIVVVAHHCQGSAQGMYTSLPWKGYADSGKYIIIYPEAPDPGKCWDVHTTATLTHNAGGDSLGVVSAVRWTISNFNANPKRVYVTGGSSGGMMTNVLLGAYPDVFAAGSAWAGVPYSCFAGSSLWNSNCAQGKLIKTGAEWGNAVRNGYPGYTGTRPKMQSWHGTADTTLYYQNFKEQIKQWTNVFGVSETPTATTQNYAASGWTKTDYGPNFQAVSAQGVGHGIPYQGTYVKQWFGLP